jgi:hypothetical protein
MTACATLISTKANAATLTVTPVGEILKSPGELIQFIFEFTPTPSRVATSLALIFSLDGSELSQTEPGILPPPGNMIITGPTIIANPTYRVLTPVRDGISDTGAILLYQEVDPSGGIFNSILTVEGADVVPVEPVPEPLTMFGTATALGYGVILKRKSSKKTAS